MSKLKDIIVGVLLICLLTAGLSINRLFRNNAIAGLGIDHVFSKENIYYTFKYIAIVVVIFLPILLIRGYSKNTNDDENDKKESE